MFSSRRNVSGLGTIAIVVRAYSGMNDRKIILHGSLMIRHLTIKCHFTSDHFSGVQILLSSIRLAILTRGTCSYPVHSNDIDLYMHRDVNKGDNQGQKRGEVNLLSHQVCKEWDKQDHVHDHVSLLHPTHSGRKSRDILKMQPMCVLQDDITWMFSSWYVNYDPRSLVVS